MRTLALLAVLVCAVGAQAPTGKSVDYKDGDTVLEGYLAIPDKDGARPGVLIVHQWKGLGEFERGKADELARLGYVAFAVDIYGKGVRPKTPAEAGAEAGKYRGADPALYRSRLKAGLATLLSQPGVDPKRIAAIGFCFGGTGVLELARSGADIAGVVSFHGGLGTSRPEDARNIRCKVLALHGADDPLVPEAEVQGFMKEMRGAKVDFQFVAYGGAVHAFTDPRANVAVAKYHPVAARRSWQAMRNFFDELFGR